MTGTTTKRVPRTYVMDSRASKDLKQALEDEGIKYQSAPPLNHNKNLEERSIQIFKSCFKAGLVSLDPTFPLSG